MNFYAVLIKKITSEDLYFTTLVKVDKVAKYNENNNDKISKHIILELITKLYESR